MYVCIYNPVLQIIIYSTFIVIVFDPLILLKMLIETAL